MFWTLACLNGMQTENRTRKSHITSARGDSDVWGLLTELLLELNSLSDTLDAKPEDNATVLLLELNSLSDTL